ncbi:MAG: hypothetical protein NW226_03115 [Microscillaceae bacterium]|nr:hypothetical protein [Microscillaceae bacterium]
MTIAQETDEQIATPQSEDTLTTKTLDSLDSKSRFLALEKGGKIKRVRFYEGERLYFRLKDDQMRYKPVIEEIGKDYIKVNNTALHLNEIASVTLYPERRLIRLMSQFLVIAGTGYFLIDMVNHSFSTTRESAIVSSSLASTGLALSLTLKPRKIRLNNKRYLKTIQKFE